MGGYMSWQEAEARSPTVSSNPTSAGYGGGSYARTGLPLQRDDDRDRERNTIVQQWNNQTGQWETQQQSSYYQQQPTVQDQARAAGSDPVAMMRAGGQQAAQQAQKDYFNRADIYVPDDPAQLNLMKQGYTAGQAAEMLRFDAQQRQDFRAERKYETLRTQAWTTATGESAAYHTAAKESGLPQAANPYEYGADLFTYAEKGYPQKKSESFSPVDYSILNLPEGQGGQAHIWQSDADRRYDLRGAMDTVASAQRSGQMGAYGGLSASSSAYGKMSLEEQQAVGRYVNENPIHQANGFRTNEGAMAQFTPDVRAKNQGAFVSSMQPTVQMSSMGKTEQQTTQMSSIGKPAGGDVLKKDWNPFVASAAPMSGNITQQAEPSAYRNQNNAVDAGGSIKKPFLSLSTGESVQVVKEKQSGALPFVGVVPGISPFIANFMPQKETVKVTEKSKDVDNLPWGTTYFRDEQTGAYGAAYTRSFVDAKGKATPVADIAVGEPKISAPYAVGAPIITRSINTKTGEIQTFSEQQYQQDVTQDVATVDLRKGTVTPTTTTVREGQTPFTEAMQRYLPEYNKKDDGYSALRPDAIAGKSPLLSSYQTNEGKKTYLLTPLIGEERASAIGENATGVTSFIQKNVPMTPVWAQTSYKNIREDPAFAAPIVAMSVAIPATGGALRYAVPAATLKTVSSNAAYKAGSYGASAGLAYLFGNYAAKEVTGTSISDVVSNNAKTVVAGNNYAPGEKPMDTAELVQKNWIGWDKAGDKANRLGLEMVAGYGAYTATDWAAMRTTQFKKIATDAKTQPSARTDLTSRKTEFQQESNEGFTTLNSIEQKDLRQSFIEGKMATSNPGKITEARYSASGRKLGGQDYPTNPQTFAKEGTTDIYSGQPGRRLDVGHVTKGASEIEGMSTSPSGITYFTKATENGMGLGISEDFLGLARSPTMYVSAVPKRYQEVPKNIRETPTLGLSANDPANPRNLAIDRWIRDNAEPGVPILVQHGKSEFEFHIKAGSEVAPAEHLGYYMDNGIPIPLQRRDYTGRMSPNYVETPLPVKEYKWYASVGAISSGSGVGSRIVPYAASSVFRGEKSSPLEKSSVMSTQKSDIGSISRPRSSSIMSSSRGMSSFSPSKSISRSGSGTESKSQSKSRTPSRSPSLFPSVSPTRSRTATATEITRTPSKTPSLTRTTSTTRTTGSELSRSRWSQTPSRSASRSQTPSVSSEWSRTVRPVEPGLGGGFGSGIGSGGGRGRGGRRMTQVLTMNFGQVTSSLFGGSPQSVGGARRTKKRK